ncbi:DUF4129 domain-containing protein [Nonlabens xiamenensis]|uniref:DUF4129 domain-containing protein n=1 Tax=Nonlabens xiamenensis TaxID=2341043 RepID=UPI000F60A115|nr:DUF4129 domain-containing protein [Nonlabens xiamenensis]
MKFRPWTFICFFCLGSLWGQAQIQQVEDLIDQLEHQPVEIVDTLEREYDTRKLEVRQWEPGLNEEYRGRDFNYRQLEGSSQNLLGRFMSWMLEGLQNIFGFTLSPLTVKLLTYLFYILIGIGVIYMIVRVLGKETASKLFGHTPKSASRVEIEETHIEEIDFTDFIAQSEREGNYRSAIRYQYLALLKALSQQGILEWDFQKTNTDYYRELNDPAMRDQFKKVSYLYDHVWYGEFPIDEASYRTAVSEFNHLKKWRPNE